MSDIPLVSNKNILVVVAHPDDAESFCGGTIAKIVQRGNRVTVVICTNGDRGSHNSQIRPSDLVQVRQLEQDRARKILGIKDVIWLGYRDGELATVSDLRERIIRVIRQQQPTIIVSFDHWKDISSTIELKVKSRLAHRSQNDFILCEEDRQTFIRQIKTKAEEAGKACGSAYAEAFYKVDQ